MAIRKYQYVVHLIENYLCVCHSHKQDVFCLLGQGLPQNSVASSAKGLIVKTMSWLLKIWFYLFKIVMFFVCFANHIPQQSWSSLNLIDRIWTILLILILWILYGQSLLDGKFAAHSAKSNDKIFALDTSDDERWQFVGQLYNSTQFTALPWKKCILTVSLVT